MAVNTLHLGLRRQYCRVSNANVEASRRVNRSCKRESTAYFLGLFVLMTVCLYVYSKTAQVPCPSHVDVDLQLACVPDTLASVDVPSSEHSRKTSECPALPAQTLPEPYPCTNDMFKGAKNITCFSQSVFYRKWLVYEKVLIGTYEVAWVSRSHFISERKRHYVYSCRNFVDDQLPKISYKESVTLKQFIRSV